VYSNVDCRQLFFFPLFKMSVDNRSCQCCDVANDHNTDGIRINERPQVLRLLDAMADVALRGNAPCTSSLEGHTTAVHIHVRSTGSRFELLLSLTERNRTAWACALPPSRAAGDVSNRARALTVDAPPARFTIGVENDNVLEAIARGGLDDAILTRMAQSRTARRKRVEVLIGERDAVACLFAPLARAARREQIVRAATLRGRCGTHVAFYRSAVRQRLTERCAWVWAAIWIPLFVAFEILAAGSAISVIALCGGRGAEPTNPRVPGFCERIRVGPAIGQLVFVAMAWVFFPVSLCCPERCCAPKEWFELPAPPAEAAHPAGAGAVAVVATAARNE
jgi:hypothetical protein